MGHHWQEWREAGVSTLGQPELARQVRLTNVASAAMICISLPWVGVLLGRGQVLPAAASLTGGVLLSALAHRMNRAGYTALSRWTMLAAIQVSVTVAMFASPVEAGWSALPFLVLTIAPMVFRGDERAPLTLFLLSPVLGYIAAEYWGVTDLTAYEQILGTPAQEFQVALQQERVAAVVTVCAVVGAMIFGQQHEQARTEAALAAREAEAHAARREAERARVVAEEAAKAKSTFLATMSHEIRTPMNGVIGMVQLLRQTELSADQREMLETVGQSGDALLAILNDILDFSKIEAGAMHLESIPFEPATVGRRVVALLAAQAGAKGVGLEIEAEPGWVVGDPGRYQQVLFNLVGNAVKFTIAGEVRVTITHEVQNGQVTLRSAVRDSGIGMTPEETSRLFQSFQQAESSTARRFGGTGLGLVICRRLAESMGGNIAVVSEKGVGSTFTLTSAHLRGAPPTPASASNRPAPARPFGTVATLRVLVADDNAVNRQIAGRMLARLGVQNVGFVADGLEALSALERDPWDLVLMDGEMPNLDGYAATERWRQIEANRGLGRVRVIALTAGAFAEDRERALACGMDDFLTKPLKIDVLSAALENAGTLALSG
jgi:signal transduction histidine kinase/CheY-like chemotaxis protein